MKNRNNNNFNLYYYNIEYIDRNKTDSNIPLFKHEQLCLPNSKESTRTIPMIILEDEIQKEKLENYLETIKKAIEKIHNDQFDGLYFEYIYRLIYYLTKSERAEDLYKILECCIQEYIYRKMTECTKLIEDSNEQFLIHFNECFQSMDKCLKNIDCMFLYMQQSYVSKNHLASVEKLYKQECFKFLNDNPGFEKKLEIAIISLAIKPKSKWLLRNKDNVDKRIIADAVTNIRYLREQGFSLIDKIEEELKNLIINHYNKCLEIKPDVNNFMKSIEKIISYIENEKCLHLEMKFSKSLLNEVGSFLTNFLLDTIHLNINNEIVNYITERKSDLLHAIFKYWQEFQIDIMPFMKFFGNIMLNDGKERLNGVLTNNSHQDESIISLKYIDICMDFLNHYLSIVQPLSKESILMAHFNQCVADVVNTSPLVSKYFCIFIHKNILKKQHDLNQHQNVISSIEELFKLIKDKELFRCFYQDYLVQRMLMNSFDNIHIEKKIIHILHGYCGSSYVSVLNEIISEFSLSKIHAVDFMDWLRDTKQTPKYLFNVYILNKKYYPTESTSIKTPFLPEDCLSLFQLLKNYYLQEKPKRKLEISPYLGDAVLELTFTYNKNNSTTYNITTSTTMMIILMMFSNKNCYTVKELKEISNLSHEKIKTALYSLALTDKNPHLIMLSPSTSSDSPYSDHTVYILNQKFYHTSSKIDLLTITPLDVIREHDKKHMDISLQSQAYQTQATIIKIMKTAKQLNHDNLVNQVRNQLCNKFDITYDFIKIQINRLIDSEYIRRTSATTSTYEYI